MSVNRIRAAVMASCAVIAISAAPGLAAQADHQAHQAAAAKAKPASAMDVKCDAMMAEHAKMMVDMKAADQRIDNLVAIMNGAAGTEKMAATARVVTEKITQDRTMRDVMMKMEHDMIGHMMEHMQAGKESMASCPMMKKMDSMK